MSPPRSELVFIGTADLSGHVRGKSVPLRELAEAMAHGVGWTPTNIMIGPDGTIRDTPFGTAGDVRLCPDPGTEIRVDYADGSAIEHLVLADLRELDGRPWACCPRDFLRRGLAALHALGWRLTAAFEQEFSYSGLPVFPGKPYSLGAFRRQGVFGERLVGALHEAGLGVETFLAEYGDGQCEITIRPAEGMAAADQAIQVRELARATAFRLGQRASFTPMPTPDGTGNGCHIHMSLGPVDGAIAQAVDTDWGMIPAMRGFAEGIRAHMPALCAVAAPSPVSYLRLTPNRWAPTMTDIAVQERGTALRVNPVPAGADAAAHARGAHFELRIPDGAASPYLALGAIVWAGVDGLRRGQDLPAPGEVARLARPLPRNLGEAAEALAATGAAVDWFGPILLDALLRARRAEAADFSARDPGELCALFAEIY